jgi:hypothetical protein
MNHLAGNVWAFCKGQLIIWLDLYYAYTWHGHGVSRFLVAKLSANFVFLSFLTIGSFKTVCKLELAQLCARALVFMPYLWNFSSSLKAFGLRKMCRFKIWTHDLKWLLPFEPWIWFYYLSFLVSYRSKIAPCLTLASFHLLITTDNSVKLHDMFNYHSQFSNWWIQLRSWIAAQLGIRCILHVTSSRIILLSIFKSNYSWKLKLYKAYIEGFYKFT